eukprot:g4884.t1
MVSVSEANAATTAVAPAIDISIVVDESGSVKTLCSGTLDCYDDERRFATELVRLLDAEVGLFGKGGTALYLEYSNTVNVNEAFSSEADYLAFVEAQTHDGGGTYIGTAIAAARDELMALPGRENRSQIMVVMTDGHEGGHTDPAEEAALATEAGITVYVVAVDVTSAASPTCEDSDFWPSCIDEATMLQVAGAQERLFVVNTFERLRDSVLQDVLAGIGIPCSATGATLRLELDKEPVDVPAVSSGEVEISATTLTWNMEPLGEPVNMTLVVDYCHCEDQRATVDFISSANYADDEVNEPSLLGLLDLTAHVAELCPTPGPSVAPTLRPTIAPSIAPTISPTAGATNSSLPSPFLPTPAPHPLSNVSGRDSDTRWYERLSIVLPATAVLGAAIMLWAVVKGFCCCCSCFGRKAAVSPGGKKKVKCPACGQPVWVAYFSLQDEARCSCDLLREKAEASARGGHAGTALTRHGARSNVMSEGFGTRRVLSRVDPEHALTCVHCGVSFCAPCDVRDKKRAFPFLIENIPDRKEEETRRAATSESRKAKQMWAFLLGQRKRIKVEPGQADENKRKDPDEVVHKNPEKETDLEGPTAAAGGAGPRLEGGREIGGKRHEEERRDENDSDTNGRRGPLSSSSPMPDIVAQRPPVPFSNGPYPEALPSDLGSKQKHGRKEDIPAKRTEARDQENNRGGKGGGGEEEAANGGTREERGHGSNGGSEGGRPGGWSSGVWSSLRAAMSGRE